MNYQNKKFKFIVKLIITFYFLNFVNISYASFKVVIHYTNKTDIKILDNQVPYLYTCKLSNASNESVMQFLSDNEEELHCNFIFNKKNKDGRTPVMYFIHENKSYRFFIQDMGNWKLKLYYGDYNSDSNTFIELHTIQLNGTLPYVTIYSNNNKVFIMNREDKHSIYEIVKWNN